MRPTYFSGACLSAFGILAIAASASANTTYDTTYAWDGSSAISPWGQPNTATYGETFVAPTDNILDSVTFYVQGYEGEQATYVAQVYSWSGSLFGGNGPQGAVGTALYQSNVMSYTASGGFDALSFSPNVALTSGDNYVVDLEALTSDGTFVMGYTGAHNSGDGNGGFNFYNNGTSANNTGNWDDFGDFGDAAYTATFSSTSTPSPAALLPFAAGLIGIRRRRANKA